MTSRNIVYVDDELPNLLVFEEWFGEGYALSTFAHPQLALDRIALGDVAVLVTDQRMPGMFGTELLAKVKEISPTTIGVLMTAFDDSATIRQALNDRLALSYVLKPYRHAEVRVVLDAALEAHYLATARHELEQRMKRSERFTTLGSLLAGVMHDLRAPLGMLGAVLKELGAELEKPDPMPEVREIAADAISFHARAAELVEGVMRFMSARKREDRGDVGLAARHAVSIANGELRARSGVLTLEVVEPGTTLVELDTSELTRIMVNLLANAAQALPERGGGAVTFTVTTTASTVDVIVRDNGSGIAPEVLSRLTEPLFTTKGTGTGLGLYTIRRMAEDVRGSLTIDSQVGVGTIARVRLPRVPAGA